MTFVIVLLCGAVYLCPMEEPIKIWLSQKDWQKIRDGAKVIEKNDITIIVKGKEISATHESGRSVKIMNKNQDHEKRN